MSTDMSTNMNKDIRELKKIISDAKNSREISPLRKNVNKLVVCVGSILLSEKGKEIMIVKSQKGLGECEFQLDYKKLSIDKNTLEETVEEFNKVGSSIFPIKHLKSSARVVSICFSRKLLVRLTW